MQHPRTARALVGTALPVLAAALALTACKSGGTLVSVATLDPGEACAAGGVVISSGVDDNNDGELQQGEITSSETVCTGTVAVNALVTTTELPLGDADCAYGGVRIDGGMDDGAPGGVGSDGVLQAEEIDHTEIVCNGKPAFEPVDFDPPAGAGTHTIDVSGGDGVDGGGNGGGLEMRFEAGSNGGGARIYATGTADASFTMPTAGYSLGERGVTFATSTTVRAVATVSGLANGEVFTFLNGASVYQWDGVTANQVTGISIAAGATVTFEPNGGAGVTLALDHDLHVAGTLTTSRVAGSPASLRLETAGLVIAPTGRLDLGATGTTGAAGGSIVAYTSFGMQLEGTLVTAGASGPIGGEAGSVELESTLGLRSTATVDAHGGDATAGSGARAGRVTMGTRWGPLYVAGALEADGGSGTQGGGNGGEGGFFIEGVGEARISVDITANGGDATACTAVCTAGGGGYAITDVYGSDVTWTGDVDLDGGNATLAGLRGVPTAIAYGGPGGNARIYLGEGASPSNGIAATGSGAVAASFTMRGGDGTRGGTGGHAYFVSDTGSLPLAQQLTVYGVTTLRGTGGDSTGTDGAGGNGAVLWVRTNASSGAGFPSDDGPGGPVIVHADLVLDGGAGTGAGGRGGHGGSVALGTDADIGALAEWDQVLLFGDVHAVGGAGLLGGDGGDISVEGTVAVEVGGALTLHGGAGGTDGSAGEGGDVQVECDGPIAIDGDVALHGGDATGGAGTGGGGGGIQVIGATLTATGDIDAHGGDGGTATGGTGGGGGEVFLLSVTGPTVAPSSIDVDAGAGLTPGEPGVIIVDGSDVTASF